MFNLYFHGNRKENKISLTFDDGPSKETEKVLEILKKHNLKATFFVTGKRIDKNKKIIRKIISDGHEIGNHSNNHKALAFRSKDYIKKDLNKCNKKLSKFNIKTSLFRPPYLSIGINLLIICNKTKQKIIVCDVISKDFLMLGVDKIVNRVLKKTKNGSIINFHDYIEGIGSNKDLPEILEKTLPVLKEKYNFVSISEIINKK